MINRIKGTNDIIEDSYVWQWVEEKLKEVSKRFGFSEIRTPIFEATELFKRGVGTDTDIVQKEMYTFTDKGGRSLTLRPEGTASVMRAFVEHSLDSKGLPQKLFYMGPMFRYEKPQAGRQRQFHQYGAELIGSPRPEADVMIIALAVEELKSLGLKDFKLKINSTGCEKCRPKYKEALREYYKPLLGKLCDDCQVRYNRNVLRLLDCKKDAHYAKEAPIILDYLCDDCKAHFDKVKELLNTLGIDYEVDPTIVRGLDYYTRTVFEITHTGLGAQDAIAGGGRYDHLIEELGGRPTPSVGFAMGMERVLIALEKEGKMPAKMPPQVYIVAVDEAQRAHALKIALELSKEFMVEVDVMGRKMKTQFKNASKCGALHVLVVGEEEVESELYTFKNMESGSQIKVPLSEIKKILRKEKCDSNFQWH